MGTMTVEQLKDLITHAKNSGVLKLCYDGVELIIDSEPVTTKAPAGDDLLFYSSN
jgi:hypothetical protein